MPSTPPDQAAYEAPPLLGRWPNLYAFVLLAHLVFITFVYLVSLTFA